MLMAIGFRSTPRAEDELEGVLLPQPSARASLCVCGEGGTSEAKKSKSHIWGARGL